MKAKFFIRLSFALLGSWAAVATQAQPAQEKIELQGDLKLGASQTKTLAPGTTHEWLMVLEKGQFAAVEVSQKSTNVEWYAVQTGGQVIVEVSQKSSAVKIRIVDPAGALRGTFNKPKDNGETQKAAWISDTAGIWMVKIGAPAATSPTGDYEIKWTVQREATAIDGAIIEADSLDSIAHTYLAQGKQAEAKSLYEQALKIRLNVLGPEHLQVAASLAFLSDLCNKQRRFAAADSFLEKALSIREKVLGPDHPALNRTLIPLALFRNTLRRFPESESLLQRALTIQEKSATPNYNQMADILLHLGAIVRGQNKYAEAEPFYMRAVAILEKMFGPEDSKVAEGCNNLARLYRDQGKYVEAEPLNRRALTIAEKNFGASHRNVAICQTNLAVVLSRLGKYAEAESLHTRAVATMEKILGSNHYQVAMLLNNLAQLFQAQSKYALARKFFEKALAIHEKAGSTRSLEMIACLINLADTILKQDRSKGDTCSLLIDRAFDFLKAKPEQFYFYARAYRLRAQLRRQQGEEKGALDDFIEALRYAERLRSQSGTSETTRADYFEEFTQVFDQIVSLELQTGQMQEAFTYSERARAGVLSQALQEAAAKTFAGIPASLLQKDKIMREQMAAIEPEIKKGAATKSPLDSLKSKNLEEQYLVLAAAHNDLLKHLEHDYPRYYDLKYQTRTVSVPELQKSLADHVAVLEYFIGDSALHIFAVTKDRFGVITVPKDSGFAKLVEAFYFAVRKADTPKYLATANALYEFLIEPIDEHLAGKDKLVIIPHNLLYKVPFEALIKTPFKSAERKTVDYRQLDYLVKHFDISYHYSATLYAKSLQERATRLADEATASNSFMGFAPVFRDNDQTGYTLASKDLPWLREENDESVRGIVVEGRKFVELKYSEGEIKSIVTLFTKKAKAQESIGYFHAKATEQNFKANVKNYRYVHIATHSFINQDKPALSGIVFAQPTDSTASEDGVLYAAETYNLNLNADLVVLSSCESGLGKLIQGEGMMAMTRGFLYSGAANLIFSLWKVSDKYSRDLMVAFYQNALEGKSYAQALRQAKLKMIANKATAAPRLWSSFVLIGVE